MTLAFRTDVPIGESMRLEECLPPPLRISSPERKQQLIANGVAVWAFLENELVGECYGAPASFAQDPDIAKWASDAGCICVFGCEIFDAYRQRGFSQRLFGRWTEMARSRGFTTVVGHAAHLAMLATVERVGAEILAVRENWGGAGGPASLFRLPLT